MDFRNRNSRDMDFRNSKDIDFRSGQYANTSQSFSIPYIGNMRSSSPFHGSNRHDNDRYSPTNAIQLPNRSKDFDECSMESMEKTHDDFEDFNTMDIVQYPIDKIRMARNALNASDTRGRLDNMRGNDRSDQQSRSQRRSPTRRSRSHTRRKRSPSPKSRRDRNVSRSNRRSTQRARSPRQERNAEFNDRSHVQNQPSNSRQDEPRRNSMPMMNPMLTPNFPSGMPNDFNRSGTDFQVAPNLSQVTPNLSQMTPNLSQMTPNLSQMNPNLTQMTPNLSQMNPNLPQAVPNLQMMVANLSQMIAASITQSVAQGNSPQLANGIAQLMGVNNVPTNPMQDWSDPRDMGSLNPAPGFQGSMPNWMNYPAPDNQQYPEFSRINESYMPSHDESFRGSEHLLTPRRSPLRCSQELRSRSPMRSRNRSPIRRVSRSPLSRRNRSPRRLSPFNSRLRSPISGRNLSPLHSRPRSPFNSRRSPVKRSRSPLNSRKRSPRQRNSRNRSPRPRSPLNSRKRSPLHPRQRSRQNSRNKSPLNPRQRSRQNSKNKSPLNPRRSQPKTTELALSEQKPLNLPKLHHMLHSRRRRQRKRNRSNKRSPKTSESHNSPSQMPPEPTMSVNAILSKMAETVKAVQAMSNSLSRPDTRDQPKPRIQPRNVPKQQHKIPNQQRNRGIQQPAQLTGLQKRKEKNLLRKEMYLKRKFANLPSGEVTTDKNTQPLDNLTSEVSH